MRIGVSPILTRQLCAAMFALSGHLFFAICLALGLLQIQPERSIARKTPVVHIRLTSAGTGIARPVASPPAMTTPVPGARNDDMLKTPSGNTADALPLKPKLSLPDAIEPVTPLPARPPSPSQAAAPPPPATEQAITARQPGLPGSPQGTVADKPGENISTHSANSRVITSSSQSLPATGKAQTGTAPVDIPYYHSLKQLTEKPRVVEDAASGMNLILPGVETQNVILRLLINEQGQVDQVEIEHSTLMSNIEAVVTAAFAKLRFSPGKIDGVAVKCQLQIEVSLENADTPALQRQPMQQ